MDSILPVTATFEPGPADGALSDADLAKINATCVKPYKAEDLYGFPCVMATDKLTDYGTRMGASSLINFASDAENGVPYHIMHERQPAPYGYTFAGQYDAGSNQARAGVFIPRGRMPAGKDGRSSNQEISDLMAGMRREVSVGFGGALMSMTCDVCQQDAMSWDCPHVPGMRYDGKLSTATVDNARLVELSGVDRGACPGAVVGKAREMFARNQFSAKSFADWCDRTHVPNELRTYSIPANAGEGEKPMALRAALIGALSALALGEFANSLSNIEDDPEKLSQALAGKVRSHIDTEVASKLAADPLLGALKTAEIGDPAKLQETLKSADYGRTAATKLRADAKAEGIRALGQEQAAGIEQTLASLPIEAVEVLKRTWTSTADAKYGTQKDKPADRQTLPGKLPEIPKEHAGNADGGDKPDKATRRRTLLSHDPVGKEILKREEARR